jgi:hypothetical protein
MRIAFDLDGVLADLHTPFARAAVRLFPTLEPRAVADPDVGSSPPDEARESTVPDEGPVSASTVPLTREQTDAVWSELRAIENFWETLDEIEGGTLSRLARLVEERRWELIFITSRPSSAGQTVQRQSQRWLERQGYSLPSLFVVHGSRGRVADALNLDVVVDDRLENCLDVVLESRAGAILVWRGSAPGVPTSAHSMGIAVVPTVAGCLDALVEAERTTQDTGFVARLRQLFGLGHRAASSFLRE